jgi:hypothetical protein
MKRLAPVPTAYPAALVSRVWHSLWAQSQRQQRQWQQQAKQQLRTCQDLAATTTQGAEKLLQNCDTLAEVHEVFERFCVGCLMAFTYNSNMSHIMQYSR